MGDCELLVGDTGLAVPLGSAEALAEGVREMLGRDRCADGLRARRRIQENYSTARLIARTEEALWRKD